MWNARISKYCLLFKFLLPDWKDSKGKETPCELVGTHLWSAHFLDQRWKCSQKRLIILMYFTGNTYRDKWFYIEKEALSEMQRKRSVRTKRKMFLNACKFSQQADQHQHKLLGVVEGREEGGRKYSDFWAGVSNVTQEPLPFTTPCSAAILLPLLFCNMCATKANLAWYEHSTNNCK